jgi:hypothetical protein
MLKRSLSGGASCATEQQHVLLGCQQLEHPGVLRAVADGSRDTDLAGVSGEKAGADAEEGRLSGAVFADEGDGFARPHVEVDAV